MNEVSAEWPKAFMFNWICMATPPPRPADLEHDIVFRGHSSSQPVEDWSAKLIEGGAILLPAPPFSLPFFQMCCQMC
jgi:hypothetical protein